MKESEVVLALHERSRSQQNPTGAVCACFFFPKTRACSDPKKQREGLEQEISVDTCRGALPEGEYLLPFVKMQHTIPYAFVQGVGSNLWAHTLHPPQLLRPLARPLQSWRWQWQCCCQEADDLWSHGSRMGWRRP